MRIKRYLFKDACTTFLISKINFYFENLSQKLYLILLSVLLISCQQQKNNAKIENHINESSSNLVNKTIKQQSSEAMSEKFNARDPFKKSHQNNQINLLQKYPLEELVMVGAIIKANKIWGIIRTPEGKIYSVIAGNHIGKYSGKIEQIMPEQILVKEKIPMNGLTQEKIRTLTLVQ